MVAHHHIQLNPMLISMVFLCLMIHITLNQKQSPPLTFWFDNPDGGYQNGGCRILAPMQSSTSYCFMDDMQQRR